MVVERSTTTRIGFSAKHAMVTTVRGHFEAFEGQLVLNGDHPADSSASVTIQAASFSNGSEDRDHHVRSADFLDVETFPTLAFTAREVRLTGDDRIGFTGATTISRKDFDLTWNVALEAGGVLVSDKVKITLDVSAIKQS